MAFDFVRQLASTLVFPRARAMKTAWRSAIGRRLSAVDSGLARGAAVTVQTANGPVPAFSTVLKQVRLGSIGLSGVPALINPGMEGDEVLLGMSFLKHLEFTQRGDRLHLRQGP